MEDDGEWKEVKSKARKNMPTPPGLHQRRDDRGGNRICALSVEDHIGGVFDEEAKEPEEQQEINVVGNLNEKEMMRQGFERHTAVLDSGAVDNVAPIGEFKHVKIRPSARSKAGKGFVSATGQPIKNHGEQNITLMTNQGQMRRIVFQVANVRRPLVSVKRVVQAGNSVHLTGDGPYIMNIATKEKTYLRCEGGLYLLDLWVRKPGFPRQGA